MSTEVLSIQTTKANWQIGGVEVADSKGFRCQSREFNLELR